MDVVLTVLKQVFRALGQQEKHLEPFLTQKQLRQIALGEIRSIACTASLTLSRHFIIIIIIIIIIIVIIKCAYYEIVISDFKCIKLVPNR